MRGASGAILADLSRSGAAHRPGATGALAAEPQRHQVTCHTMTRLLPESAMARRSPAMLKP